MTEQMPARKNRRALLDRGRGSCRCRHTGHCNPCGSTHRCCSGSDLGDRTHRSNRRSRAHRSAWRNWPDWSDWRTRSHRPGRCWCHWRDWQWCHRRDGPCPAHTGPTGPTGPTVPMPVVLRLHYDAAGAAVFVAHSSVPNSLLTYDVGTQTVSMFIPAGTFPPGSLLAQLWFGDGADDVSGGARVASLWGEHRGYRREASTCPSSICLRSSQPWTCC